LSVHCSPTLLQHGLVLFQSSAIQFYESILKLFIILLAVDLSIVKLFNDIITLSVLFLAVQLFKFIQKYFYNFEAENILTVVAAFDRDVVEE